MKIMKVLAIIEIIILVWGFFAIGIAYNMISYQELKLQQERQANLKVRNVYHDCFCRDIHNK